METTLNDRYHHQPGRRARQPAAQIRRQLPRHLLRAAAGDPVSGWKPDGTGIVSNGDCGGDIQRGDSYSVRYRNPGLPNAVITSTAYAAEYDSNPGDFFVQVQTEWVICNDPEHPGDTETWSDANYDDEAIIYNTAAEAEEAARQLAAEFPDDAESPEWDGEPW